MSEPIYDKRKFNFAIRKARIKMGHNKISHESLRDFAKWVIHFYNEGQNK